ncbi:MAG: site-specific DNA-methyltransferase [Candidatus Coatesbacteria bacterium]|nr:site-specific DNA-methyltransferase [Candidatus Coatesbacteria bacterium]
MGPPVNRLYLGDNLAILRSQTPDASVDLIYLDPPFNSGKAYRISPEEGDMAVGIAAFRDTWKWDDAAKSIFRELIDSGPEKVVKSLQAFRDILGECGMMAYITFVAPRLIELRRVLRSTGSIYLHCDPIASHYLKLLMDSVFDRKNFLNEIVWSYDAGGRSKRRFGRKHDVILLYARSKDYYFDGDAVRIEMKAGKSSFGGRLCVDDTGRKFREVWGTGRKKLYRYYLDAGKIPEDVWHIPSIQSQDGERVGYPTQKPEALLSRIIEASSKPGDTVLDPFCGSGTTLVVAERLKRNWIGIDTSEHAIALARDRIEREFGATRTRN